MCSILLNTTVEISKIKYVQSGNVEEKYAYILKAKHKVSRAVRTIET